MAGIADSTVGQLSNLYVETLANLHPCAATMMGIHAHDEELTDWSPTGLTARADLARKTIAELDALGPDDIKTAAEQRAVDQMRSELQRSVALHDAREDARDLNILFSPGHFTRKCFDVMPRATAEDWQRIAIRLTQVPDCLHTHRMTLEEGRRTGEVGPRRQAVALADQFDVFGGRGGSDPYFATLAGQAPADLDEVSRRRLDEAAAKATGAYAGLADYLRGTYATDADPTDGVGGDRYRLHAASVLDADIDVEEAYDWAWRELARIDAEATEAAGQILPGASLPEVHEHLQTVGPAHGDTDTFRAWAQGLQNEAIDRLHGTTFDIPEAIRHIEVVLAPAGSAAAPYYSPPSEDLSRPGRTWYPYEGRDHLPTWGEVTTAYHEGVPGHHLQLATLRLCTDELTRYQVLAGGSSANAEGWALYAERLMDELGFVTDPAHRLGFLRAQALRAARVVVDIGLHLGLTIPHDVTVEIGVAPGEKWTPDLAHAVLTRHWGPDDAFLSSEVDRYLGLPAQAIGYKLGERVWMDGRTAAQRTTGFDLLAWHTEVLGIGRVGLDQLATELAAIAAR